MLGFLKNIFLRPEPPRVVRTAGAMAAHRGVRRVVLGRYDAAATTDENRRHWANADHLSANAANNPTVRRILRARARYEVANNSYARGIVLTLANDVVGTGPRLQLLTTDDAANRTVEQAFVQWAEAVRLAEKLRTMRMARAESGEVFALLTANPAIDSPVKLDLRLIEADQIATPVVNLAGGPAYRQAGVDGILFDAYGNPIEYHLLRAHPGDASAVGDSLPGFDRVPASAMLHYQFSETHYLADSVVTPAYRGTLFYLTGKVNNGSFRGLAPGECLFLGASGSKRGESDWEITFRFAGSPNVTGLTVGSIGGINKKGWEYMWVRYADSEDAAAKVLVKKPVAVYIEKVYELANFSQLGIGT